MTACIAGNPQVSPQEVDMDLPDFEPAQYTGRAQDKGKAWKRCTAPREGKGDAEIGR